MATKTKAKTASKSRGGSVSRTLTQTKAYNEFIDKVTCDEIFREMVIQDPKGVLARYDLAADDLQAIRPGTGCGRCGRPQRAGNQSHGLFIEAS